MADSRKLGVIAGGGLLPRLILDQAVAEGRPVFAVGFAGHTAPGTLDGLPHLCTRPGRAGAIVRALRREGVQDVVMAGGLRRPSLRELRPDWYTLRFFARLRRQSRGAIGDDRLLRAVATLLEGEGFTVLGAHQLLRDLTVGPGTMGCVAPSAQHRADIAAGFSVAGILGGLDIGQAVVVQQGIVLGVEAVEGTDGLIARCAPLARAGARPVLVKRVKPGQDRRVDLPTVGPDTIRALAAAGFAGLAVEAGGTLVLQPAVTVAAADSAGLFLLAAAPT